MIEKLYEAQGRGCLYCGLRISIDKTDVDFAYRTLDHFIPIARGGKTHISNMVLACSQCNLDKGSRYPTREEKERWNLIAKFLPHMPLFVEPPAGKERHCQRCGVAIDSIRLDQALSSGGSTETCSKQCARAMKRRRQTRKKSSLSTDSPNTANIDAHEPREALEEKPQGELESGSLLRTSSENHRAPRHFQISDHGYILSLEDLRRLLAFVSKGPYQWSIASERSEDVNGFAWIDILYNNPGLGSLPNEIVFRFPVLRSHIPFWPDPEQDTYICLYADVASIVQNGLYFEDDFVKSDFLNDLRSFWEPLLAVLSQCARPARRH